MEQYGEILYNGDMPKKLSPEINFADLCKKIRDYYQYTQQEMAETLNVQLRSYQKYEYGEREPSAQAAFRLCQMWHEIQAKQKK